MQLLISGGDWQMIMTSGIMDWLFDVTHSFDVWLKKEKIKHKQTWMYQTLTRKWKFLLGSQLLQVCLTFTVCHHWCDIRSKLYLSESTFYSKTATQHTYFSAKVDFQIDSTVFLANSLSFRHTHTHAAWRHELNSPSHASWRSVCVSLVNKNKQHNTITTI